MFRLSGFIQAAYIYTSIRLYALSMRMRHALCSTGALTLLEYRVRGRIFPRDVFWQVLRESYIMYILVRSLSDFRLVDPVRQILYREEKAKGKTKKSTSLTVSRANGEGPPERVDTRNIIAVIAEYTKDSSLKLICGTR